MSFYILLLSNIVSSFIAIFYNSQFIYLIISFKLLSSSTFISFVSATRVWTSIQSSSLASITAFYFLFKNFLDFKTQILAIFIIIISTSRIQYGEGLRVMTIWLCQDCWWWTLFYFLFSVLFYFTLLFLFYFLFLEQPGLGFISHAITSVTNWWRSHKTDHETWENGVEGTRIKWHHTA